MDKSKDFKAIWVNAYKPKPIGVPSQAQQLVADVQQAIKEQKELLRRIDLLEKRVRELESKAT